MKTHKPSKFETRKSSASAKLETIRRKEIRGIKRNTIANTPTPTYR